MRKCPYTIFFPEPVDMLVVSVETIPRYRKNVEERTTWVYGLITDLRLSFPLIFNIQEISSQTVLSLRLQKPTVSPVTKRKSE